jgi:hypothetical protein
MKNSFDLEILNQYIMDGLIVKHDHPILPISIYNYSRKAVYDRKWDNITKSCRSLILDNQGNIVAKAFDKFFNMEELSNEEIPKEEFKVYEKLDGSLILIFKYLGELVISSKGSFSSDQVLLAEKLIKNNNLESNFREDYVYVFELIGPSNKIVLDYPKDELVLLTTYDKTSWNEILIDNSFVRTAKTYDSVNDFKTLKTIIPADEEGFVIRFKSGFRMKIKGDEYFRLHKIITNISSITLWESLKNGEDLSIILENVPDEIDSWVRDIIGNIRYNKASILNYVGKTFDYYMYGKYNDQEPVTDRKEFSQWVLTKEEWMRPILFNMFDKKNYDNIIWKLVKPKFKKP